MKKYYRHVTITGPHPARFVVGFVKKETTVCQHTSTSSIWQRLQNIFKRERKGDR